METKKPSLLEQFDMRARQLNLPQQESVSGENSSPNLAQRFEEKSKSIMETKYPEARVLTPPPAEQQRDLSGPEVLSRAVTNLPRSAVEAGTAFVEPFLNPVQTYETMKGLGKGLYSKAEGVFVDQDPQKKAQDEAIANAIGQFYANRYGSIRGIKEAVAEDPFGVLLDASSLFSGAGILGRAPGAVGKVARASQKFGEALDPVRVIPKGLGAAKDIAYKTPKVGPALEKGVSFFKNAPAELLESRAKLPPGTLETAYQAGRTKDPNLMPFVEQMRGTAPRTEIVGLVNDAIESQNQAARANFMRDRNAALSMTQPVSYNDIDSAVSNAKASIRNRAGDVIHENADRAIAAIEAKIAPFQQGNLNTLQDLDDLKRSIDDLYLMYGSDKNARRVITEVKNSIKNTIGAQSPAYLDLLDAEEARRNAIRQFEYAAGTDGAVPEKQLAQIFSSLKKEDKRAILDRIAENDPRIASALRGASAADKGRLSSTDFLVYLIGSGLLSHPVGLTVAAGKVASESPRVLGETAYGLGRGRKAISDVANAPVIRPIIETSVASSPFIQQLGQYEQRKEADERRRKFLGEANGGRVARASGGRIEILRGVRALMQAAENAKKSISKSTETLLEQPDENIAQALHVAKKNI